jgi:hypothetical protein
MMRTLVKFAVGAISFTRRIPANEINNTRYLVLILHLTFANSTIKHSIQWNSNFVEQLVR